MRPEPTRSERLGSTSSPANIRLGQKRLTVTNVLAYCTTEFIAVVKCFIVQALEVNRKNPRKYFSSFWIGCVESKIKVTKTFFLIIKFVEGNHEPPFANWTKHGLSQGILKGEVSLYS